MPYHHSPLSPRSRPRVTGPRQGGAAIVLVMLACAALAAIALSAIFMSSSTTLMTKYYDKERDFRYAAEQAVQIGKSRITMDSSVHLPDSGYIQLMNNAHINDAHGNPIPNVRVNLYGGVTGNTTGQFGQFASLVAESQDSMGNSRFVRRLEMERQNFSRFAMFTNTFSGGLCYSTGEFIRGVGMSNQIWNSCGTPTYYDTISAHTTVGGGTPTYVHGSKSGVPIIPFPTIARLTSLPSYAASANFSFTSAAKGTRLEFVAINMNYPTDSTAADANEGFFRVFNDTTGSTAAIGLQISRAYYNNATVYTNECGDWHTIGGRVEFFPFAVHSGQAWFKALELANGIAYDTGSTAANRAIVMGHTTPRKAQCYPAGDPHLVAVERPASYGLPAIQKGGEDSTFTPVTTTGYWVPWPGSVPTGLTVAGTCGIWATGLPGCPPGINSLEPAYLFPLYRAYNPNTKGVIYFNGDVALSGMLRGDVTVYTSGTAWLTDDLYYTTDPTVVTCANELGLIASQDVWIADNAINSPQNPTTPASPTGPANSVFMSDNTDFYFDGVTMALGTTSGHGTVGVENFSTGAINMTTCNGTSVGRGCIKQTGGVIEQYISATYNGAGSGLAENRSVDPCMSQQSPPYYPVTGTYIDNRYFEIDPARYNVDSLFRRLQVQ